MNINRHNIIYLTIAFCFTVPTLSTDLATLKEEIQQKFDKRVTEEQAKFVRQYGIDLNDIKEVITELTRCLDENTKKDIAFYQSEFYKSKTYVQPEALNTIQNLASQIFSQSGILKVTVLHDPEFEFSKVAVMPIYETEECYIKLNVEKHRDNVAVSEAFLRHECCHMIYQDALFKQLLQALAWSNSQESRLQVEYNTHPISRACEMRADVYAILNSSPDQAKAYIEDLNNFEEPEVATTHPKPSERIAILQEIIKTLNIATRS